MRHTAHSLARRTAAALMAAMVGLLALAGGQPCWAQACWKPCCSCDGPTTLLAWPGCERNYGGESVTIVTDRPDFTEASSTVGRGRVQLEMGYTYTYDNDGTTSTRTHGGFEPLLRVGVWRDWLELRVGWNLLDERMATGGARDSTSGGDDLYLGAKIALAEQDCWLPEFAVLPQASVGIGTDGLSHERFLPGVNFLYSWELSDRLSVAGSTQGNEAVDDGGDSYLELAQSATMGYSFTERIGGYAEWYAFFPHGAEDAGAKPEHYVNGGFTWLACDNVQFDVRAGLGLNDAADDYFMGTGVSVRF